MTIICQNKSFLLSMVNVCETEFKKNELQKNIVATWIQQMRDN